MNSTDYGHAGAEYNPPSVDAVDQGAATSPQNAGQTFQNNNNRGTDYSPAQPYPSSIDYNQSPGDPHQSDTEYGEESNADDSSANVGLPRGSDIGYTPTRVGLPLHEDSAATGGSDAVKSPPATIKHEVVDEKPLAKLDKVLVAGVEAVSTLSECITCSGEVRREEDDPELGTCVRCGMMQRVSYCKTRLVAKLVVRTDDGELFPVQAIGKVAEFIADKPAPEVTKAALLRAEPFTMMLHRDGIIRSVYR